MESINIMLRVPALTNERNYIYSLGIIVMAEGRGHALNLVQNLQPYHSVAMFDMEYTGGNHMKLLS